MADTDPDLPQLRRTLPERAASAVLPACAAEWAAGEVMHLCGQPGGAALAIGTAVAGFAAYGASGRGRIPAWTVPAVTVAGGWLAAAAEWGPLDGWPGAPLTWTCVAAALYAAWKARRHPAVTAAREWRDARAAWLADCRHLGLHGSHLLAHEYTRLGEDYVVDVSGTGKLASAVARSSLAEQMATRRRIPRSRVTVSEHAVAGQLRISVRDLDPWAEPIPHPAVTDGHEVELARRPSVTRAQPVGQDPATGQLLTLLLCGPSGGRNISIVGTIDSGKTTLLSDISERVTACPDALMIRVNVSIKGPAEEHLWGPACHLTAFGPSQAARALKILKVVARIIEWRASQPKTSANWQPSPRNPHIVLIFDEIDSAMKIGALRAALEPLATKGREYGLTIVRAGQRGTAEYTGGGNVRAVDGVWCLGTLNRSTEAMHAAGELGLRLPDVASYGEGKQGVWVIAEMGGAWQGGRAWNLSEPDDVAAIAAARAASQPDLPPECVAFLGEPYQELLGSDVYARWARGRAPAPPPPEAPGTGWARREDSARQLAPAAATATATDDGIEELDFDMDDTTRARFRALDEKLGRAREILAETRAMDPGPDVPEEKLRESSEERWRQVGEQADLSPEHREALLGLLRDGTTIAAATEALGVSTWTARACLQKLRNEGIARIDGKGRGARWRLTQDHGDDQ